MNARERWANYLPQVGIGFDQFINALIPPFITLSFADETLSARTYRAAKRGKLIGTWALPVIDWMFSWQKPDDEVNALAGYTVTGHSERAYWKEKLRRGLPPEYREAK